MSDKVTELHTEEKPARRRNVKKIVLLTALVVVVCLVLSLILFKDELNLDRVRRWFKYMGDKNDESFGRYAFDSHGSNAYGGFDGGLAVASIGGLDTYAEDGTHRHMIQQQLDLPQLLTRGSIAVAYDVGGYNLVAADKKKGEVLRLEETHPILDADISSGGAICISSSDSGYKSVLSVYNGKQDLVYRWLSASVYYPLCAIAPNGSDLAAISVGQSEGTFQSSICLFRTDSEEIKGEISLGSELIYDLVYLSGNKLCAIGETGIQFVSTGGDVVGTYQYQDSYLKDFDLGGDGFLTLSTNMYRAGNRYSIVTVDHKGREMASKYIGEEVLDISACGRYVAVLTQGNLTVYTKSLSVYYETEEAADATSVVMRSDGTAILIGGGQGRLYIP